MKKIVLLLAAGIMSTVLVACGSEEAAAAPSKTEAVENITESSESKPESGESHSESSESQSEENSSKESEAETKETGGQEEASASSQEEASAASEEEKEEKYRVGNIDNFSVSNKMAAEFGEEVKEVIAAKDLEAMADLTSFPLYMGFPDGGVSVETREDFIALGEDRVFTQEFVDGMASADTGNLSASKAGFSLTDSGRPNVIFGVSNGKLRIVGVNY
ncbi:MAG: hypothetical protein ACI4AB_05645 [Acetatifactor sp.]